MVKSIQECDDKELVNRAFLAIECISYLMDELYTSCITDPEKYRARINNLQGELYMISHAVNHKINPHYRNKIGNCQHPDWLIKIEAIEVTAKELGFYDVEQYIQP